MIKIQTETTKKINSEITNIFVKKILSIIQTKDIPYTIYNVQFFTAINDNILTLAIKCNLKEGKNAQREIIKTYNYDLENDRLLTLSDIINKKLLDYEKVQKQIKEEIEKAINKAETIKTEGYNVYQRTINDQMYNIENTTEFMLDQNNNLYIIYPYGNMNITSEMDVIVIPN